MPRVACACHNTPNVLFLQKCRVHHLGRVCTWMSESFREVKLLPQHTLSMGWAKLSKIQNLVIRVGYPQHYLSSPLKSVALQCESHAVHLIGFVRSGTMTTKPHYIAKDRVCSRANTRNASTYCQASHGPYATQIDRSSA